MTDPFKISGPTCISFSGGRTSAYMLWEILRHNGSKLPAEARVIFSNTGKEAEESLQFVKDCSDNWGIPITWLEYRDGGEFAITNFESASRNGEPFEAVIRQRGGYLPNPVSRYCSSELKTRTMHRYLRSIGWDEWDTFIGIRADENRRAAKFISNPHPETKAEYVNVPLAHAGITAADVGRFWNAQAFDLMLPNNSGKTMHGNCDLCYLKPASQILSLVTENPSRATWWIYQEEKAKEFAGSAAVFRQDRPSYAAMAQFAKDQRSIFDENEEGIACFCGD